ncbi:MAG: hypothetical protein JW384_01192 [Nitrosomonadaceae bacterium]|nr:hypothetical protein [Nitrosomonadaceae bacterium]
MSRLEPTISSRKPRSGAVSQSKYFNNSICSIMHVKLLPPSTSCIREKDGGVAGVKRMPFQSCSRSLCQSHCVASSGRASNNSAQCDPEKSDHGAFTSTQDCGRPFNTCTQVFVGISTNKDSGVAYARSGCTSSTDHQCRACMRFNTSTYWIIDGSARSSREVSDEVPKHAVQKGLSDPSFTCSGMCQSSEFSFVSGTWRTHSGHTHRIHAKSKPSSFVHELILLNCGRICFHVRFSSSEIICSPSAEPLV